MELNSSYYIQVTNLSKHYGKKQILSAVSFCAAKGECIGILGANGCGKSTLLSILSGTLKPDGGEVLYGGENPIKHPRLFSRYTGFVPQDNPLMEQMTVLDNLRLYYAKSRKSPAEDLKEGIPAMFGLAPYKNHRVSRLSGGMKKRLSIACALACRPPILILDEPGASLDFVCKEDIKSYLAFYRKNGGTVLLTSHEEGEIAMADRSYLLSRGSLLPLPPRLQKEDLLERMKGSHG